VIDIILDLWEKGYSIHTLRGNHEQMMMDSEKSESDLMLWLRNGGVEALQSFGKGSYADLDEVYRRFIEETKHYIELEDHVLAHAGLNLNAEDPLADRSSMLWSRQPHFAKFNGKTIIHGHTPIPLQQLLAQDLNGFSINLDGGCVYKKSGYGYLCALDLDRKTWLFRKSEG
jgi:serine/threonine protein phosphatase 1